MHELNVVNLISDNTCRCADCQSYSNHVENSSSCSGCELPSAECKNDSFHQTSVLYSTQSDHSKSSLLPTKWPSLPDSLLTLNGPQSKQQEYTVKQKQLSASTGRIPQVSSLDEGESVISQSCSPLIPHCKYRSLSSKFTIIVSLKQFSLQIHHNFRIQIQYSWFIVKHQAPEDIYWVQYKETNPAVKSLHNNYSWVATKGTNGWCIRNN